MIIKRINVKLDHLYRAKSIEVKPIVSSIQYDLRQSKDTLRKKSELTSSFVVKVN